VTPSRSCFAKYIDTEKQISFPDYVGRCNHEQKCGYNYTPKMYFDENPIAKERLSEKFVPVSKPGISLLPEPYLGHELIRVVDLSRASVYEQLHIPHAIHLQPKFLVHSMNRRMGCYLI
jgi:hypothetical protein